MYGNYPMIIGVEYDVDGLGITDFVFENKLEALTLDQKQEVLEKLLVCAEIVRDSMKDE